jgi:hypothetical protein
MPDGLDEGEDAPQGQRQNPHENQLDRGVIGTGCGQRVVRQDQRQRRKRPDHGQRGGCALKLECLLEMASPAEHQAEADHPVQHDHHRCEDSIARHAFTSLSPRDHDGDDQCDLDDSHRNRQQDGAEGLAKPDRQHFCMVDGGEDTRAQKQGRQGKHGGGVGGNDMTELQRQQPATEQRRNPCPDRDPSVMRTVHVLAVSCHA